MPKYEFCYEYPRPALTNDCMLFGYDNGNWYILLIQRKYDPYKNCWALPGGFVDEDETAEQGATRELKEECSVEGVELHQAFTVTELNRDPRGRTVSVIFYAIVNKRDINTRAADDAKDLEWFNIHKLPELAFDHQNIISKGIHLIQEKIILPHNFIQLTGNKFTEHEFVAVFNGLLKNSMNGKIYLKSLIKAEIISPSAEFVKSAEYEIDISTMDNTSLFFVNVMQRSM